MNPSYLELPFDHYFDYAFLLGVLKEYRSPRDKITLMIKRGEIIRIRKGLYIRARQFGGLVSPVEITNAVYGPSYVSLQYALSNYGIIPERVETITSVTFRRHRIFSTPAGKFSYSHIPKQAYPAGVNIQKHGSVNILMASREKAVCDTLAMTSGIRTMSDIEAFITEDQRMDLDEIASLSTDSLNEIETGYGMDRITIFVRWFRKNFNKNKAGI
jgi:hypothetical protein